MKKCQLYYLSIKKKRFIENPVMVTETKKKAKEIQPLFEGIYEKNIYIKEI